MLVGIRLGQMTLLYGPFHSHQIDFFLLLLNWGKIHIEENHFKVYSSVAFSKCIHNVVKPSPLLSSKTFSSRYPIPIKQLLSTPFFPSPLTITNLFPSLWIYLFWLFHIQKLCSMWPFANHCLFFDTPFPSIVPWPRSGHKLLKYPEWMKTPCLH